MLHKRPKPFSPSPDILFTDCTLPNPFALPSPGNVPMSRLHANAKQEYEFINNFKVLQAVFKKNRISKPIPVDMLIKCRMLWVESKEIGTAARHAIGSENCSRLNLAPTSFASVPRTETISNSSNGSRASGIQITLAPLMIQMRAGQVW